MSDVKTKILEAQIYSIESHETFKYDCLIIIGGELNGSVFELSQSKMSLGRSDENDIVIDIKGVSRTHLGIIIEGQRIQLIDLGSANGTYINDKKIDTRVTLRSGDLIKIGHVTLKFLTKDSIDMKAHQMLIEQATKDGLTGCFNKDYVFKALGREIANAKKGKESLSLIILDIDHFKVLNDSKGHDAGDFVLKEMARIIRNDYLNRRDIFARYGGEEFIVLMLNASAETAFSWANAIRKAIAKHDFSYDKENLRVTVSIGISEFSSDLAITANELFIQADKALYHSKQSGRNKVSCYRDLEQKNNHET